MMGNQQKFELSANMAIGNEPTRLQRLIGPLTDGVCGSWNM